VKYAVVPLIAMKFEQVVTENAPKAIGPYSQGTKANGFVFCSGQIPANPETGELETGSITNQTKQSLSNVRGVIEGAGSSMDKVVKVTVFLKNMDDFSEMNTEYSKWFSDPPPARAAVEVARLPKDVAIEIEAIALL
jgi:2-iminobutanoate/2-iminopropanoate deaminase